MRLPGEIHRAIQESAEPVFLGEEGLLTPITLDNQSYYAKQWRGHHGEGAAFGLFYGKDIDRSGVSPYWVRTKFYEYSLMNELFPDRIPKVVAGFDARISKDGNAFDRGGTRPVTMTEEVVGDPALADRRAHIVKDEYYGDLADQEVLDDQGKIVAHRENYKKHVDASRLDRRMREEFGEDLGIRDYISSNSLLSAEHTDRLVERLRERFPGTRIIELVDAGILPVHAEFNFIPKGLPDSRGANGVFLEAMIFDEARFARALLEKRVRERGASAKREEVTAEIRGKMDRYTVFRKLDELYDWAFRSAHLDRDDTDGKTSRADAAQDVVRVLDRVRERFDRGASAFTDDFYFDLRSKLIPVAFESGAQRASVVEDVMDWIDRWNGSRRKPIKKEPDARSGREASRPS